MRGYWDGKILRSRYGKKISSPNWFVLGLPDISLDGELWMGRDSFEKLQGILASKDSPHWGHVEYHVFDIPSSGDPYEHRLLHLQNLDLPKHVHIVNSIKCTGNGHLRAYLDTVVGQGGEGLMARQPNGLYTDGIADNLLKVKVFGYSFSFVMLQRFEDTEVQVLEVLETGLFCKQ